MSQSFDPYHKWLGIPPHQQPPHDYRLLGVDVLESDLDVIENAADRQMLLLRTFQTGKHGELSQQLLNEIAQAKVRLLNPETKAAYDAQLRAAIEQAKHAAEAQPPTPLPATPTLAADPAAPTVERTPEEVALDNLVSPSASSRTQSRKRSNNSGLILIAGAAVAAMILLAAGGAALWILSDTGPVIADNTPPDNSEDSSYSVEVDPAEGSQQRGENSDGESPTDPPGDPPTETQTPEQDPNPGDKVPVTPAINVEPTQLTYEELVLSLEPVVWYRMESATDDQLTDSSGKSRHAKLMGTGAKVSPAKFGNALDLPGKSAWAQFNPLPPATEGKLTVMAWVNARSTTKWASIAKTWGSKKLGQFHFGLSEDGKRLHTVTQDEQGKEVLVEDPAPFPIESWQHVAMVVSGTQLTLYRNGAMVASVPCSGLQKQPEFPLLTIGCKLNDSHAVEWNAGFWNGLIDEVMVIHDAVPVETLQQLIAASQPTDVVASNNPPEPTGDPTGESATDPTGKPPGGQLGDLWPVPAADTLDKLLADAREVYQPQWERQTTDDERRALLATMRKDSAGFGPEAKYAALTYCRQLAEQSAFPEDALQVIDMIALNYEIDVTEQQFASLLACFDHAIDLEQRTRTVTAAVAFSKQAMASENYEMGLAALEPALDLVTRIRDVELRKELVAVRDELRDRQAAYAAIADALKQVEAGESDSTANKLVGLYYITRDADWQKGLPLLANGDDKALADTAKQDIASLPKLAELSTSDYIELGDSWYRLAKLASNPQRTSLNARALKWYQLAAPIATGVQRLAVGKKIAEITSDGVPSLWSPGQKVLVLTDQGGEWDRIHKAFAEFGLADERFGGFGGVKDPSMLRNYHTIVTGSNAMDFWAGKTAEQWEPYDAWIRAGGHLVVFGTYNGRNLGNIHQYGFSAGTNHNDHFQITGPASELFMQGCKELARDGDKLRSASHMEVKAPYTMLLKRGPGAFHALPAMATREIDAGRVTFCSCEPHWMGDNWILEVTARWIVRGSPVPENLEADSPEDSPKTPTE